MHLCIRACTKEQEKVLPVEDVAMTTIQGGLTEAQKSDDAIRPYTSSEGNALCWWYSPVRQIENSVVFIEEVNKW